MKITHKQLDYILDSLDFERVRNHASTDDWDSLKRIDKVCAITNAYPDKSELYYLLYADYHKLVDSLY